MVTHSSILAGEFLERYLVGYSLWGHSQTQLSDFYSTNLPFNPISMLNLINFDVISHTFVKLSEC